MNISKLIIASVVALAFGSVSVVAHPSASGHQGPGGGPANAHVGTGVSVGHQGPGGGPAK